jgi:formylglycine-generating enzyme required for sulfatase activity
MPNRSIGFVTPKPWHPDLLGEYPGQVSYLELGSPPTRMELCWCPPALQEQLPGFWLAKHLVTQRQWQTVMENNPSRRGQGPTHPVDSVSWDDAREFCKRAGLRLPSDKEWELACRAGTTMDFAVGGGKGLNAQMANFDGNHPGGSGRDAFPWLYRGRTLPAGAFPPNAWGLHDMHGEHFEWCEDAAGDDGGERVLRGGGWITYGVHAVFAIRFRDAPAFRFDIIGFRPCPSSIQSKPEAASKLRSGPRSEAGDERNDGAA